MNYKKHHLQNFIDFITKSLFLYNHLKNGSNTLFKTQCTLVLRRNDYILVLYFLHFYSLSILTTRVTGTFININLTLIAFVSSHAFTSEAIDFISTYPSILAGFFRTIISVYLTELPSPAILAFTLVGSWSFDTFGIVLTWITSTLRKRFVTVYTSKTWCAETFITIDLIFKKKRGCLNYKIVHRKFSPML